MSSSSSSIQEKIDKLYSEIETLKQQQQQQRGTLSQEEHIEKLYTDPAYFNSFFKDLNESKPFVGHPDYNAFDKPSYPPLGYIGKKPIDQMLSNKSKNINDIIYSNNPQGEAKRIKLTKKFNEDRIKAFNEMCPGVPCGFSSFNI